MLMLVHVFNRLSQRCLTVTLILLLSLAFALPLAQAQDRAGSATPDELAKADSTATLTSKSAPTTATVTTVSSTDPGAPGALKIATSATSASQTQSSTELTTATTPSGVVAEATPLSSATPTSATATTASPAEDGAGSGAAEASSSDQGSDPAATTEAVPGRPTEGKSPYLHALKPIEIFDQEKSVQETPMQRAARLLAERKEGHKHRSLENIQNLVTYEYDLTGKNGRELIDTANLSALKAAAGRLYFANYYILGRDILEPYLKNNAKKFIARTAVVDEQALGKDKVNMRIRVSVNLDTYYKDLEDKKFIAEPNPRPIAAVFLQEIVDGQRDTALGGRVRIEQTLLANMFRSFSSRMRVPQLNEDLSNSPKLLKQARMEAQRNDVDVLITGTLAIRPIRKGQIFYDAYDFEEAEITLHLYRVDTGDLLAEVKDRYSSTAESTELAKKKVLDILESRVAQKLADYLTRSWGNTMLEGQGNYRIMVNHVDANGVTNIFNLLKTLSPEIKVYVKSYYGDVLVLNVTYPGATADTLETFLRGSKEPQFLVRKVAKRDFVLDLI